MVVGGGWLGCAQTAVPARVQRHRRRRLATAALSTCCSIQDCWWHLGSVLQSRLHYWRVHRQRWISTIGCGPGRGAPKVTLAGYVVWVNNPPLLNRLFGCTRHRARALKALDQKLAEMSSKRGKKSLLSVAGVAAPEKATSETPAAPGNV